MILPFKFSKHLAEEKLKEEFGKKLFLPADFLSTKTLEKLREYMFHSGYMILIPMLIIPQLVRRCGHGHPETGDTRRHLILMYTGNCISNTTEFRLMHQSRCRMELWT